MHAHRTHIPRSGESITEVQIGDWRKGEGDTVQQDELIVEIETDKASMDLPAPTSGRITKVLKKKGEVAHPGDVIAYIEESEKSGAECRPFFCRRRPVESARADQEVGNQKPKPAGQESRSSRGLNGQEAVAPGGLAPIGITGHSSSAGSACRPASHARVMPAARRKLAESGLSADQVTPTGPGGRILKEDVQRPAAATPAAPPRDTGAASAASESERGLAAEYAPPTDRDEIVPMSMLRKRTAQKLVEAQHNAALLTTFNEVDMTAVMKLRQEHQKAFTDKHGVKLGFMSFFVKAAVSGPAR